MLSLKDTLMTKIQKLTIKIEKYIPSHYVPKENCENISILQNKNLRQKISQGTEDRLHICIK